MPDFMSPAAFASIDARNRSGRGRSEGFLRRVRPDLTVPAPCQRSQSAPLRRRAPTSSPIGMTKGRRRHADPAV
jgi:hypothetical protein